MALAGNDVSPEKKSGFTFQGKEIVLSKTRGRPARQRTSGAGLVEDKKRIEALTIYAVTGKDSEVIKLTGVGQKQLKSWKKEQWWQEGLEEIRNENDHQFDAAFTGILEKVIGAINERLVKGDEIVFKDGTRAMKQVSLRDLVGALAYTMDKRQVIRGRPTSRTETVSVDNRLDKLNNHFVELAKKQRKEHIAPVAAPDAAGAPLPLLDEAGPQPKISQEG